MSALIRGQVMADALVERVTGRPADVPEPVAMNLVMSDQAFPRVGPAVRRPAWQSHPGRVLPSNGVPARAAVLLLDRG